MEMHMILRYLNLVGTQLARFANNPFTKISNPKSQTWSKKLNL